VVVIASVVVVGATDFVVGTAVDSVCAAFVV